MFKGTGQLIGMRMPRGVNTIGTRKTQTTLKTSPVTIAKKRRRGGRGTFVGVAAEKGHIGIVK